MATSTIKQSTATETINISIGEDQYNGFYYGETRINLFAKDIISFTIVGVTGNNYAHVQLAGTNIRAYSTLKNLTVTVKMIYAV